jgi:signal transduction histidine kinase
MLNSIYSKLGLASLFIAGLQLFFLALALPLMFDDASLPTVAVYVVVAVILAASIFGFVVFALLSRRLKLLAKAVEDFRRSNFSQPVSLVFSDESGDEISRLGFAIEQMQRKLMAQMQLSQQIDAQRRELFANVSHDLRTPLTSMRGYIETLLLKRASLTANQQSAYLEIALKQTVYLSKLIHDLFELTKLESNNAATKLETFPLSELVQDVIQKFALIAEENGVKFESNHTQSAFSTYADISLVERVLTNLIENALHYCATGALISITLKQKDARIHVQVSDTGSGIAQDKLPLIFNRMFKANAASTNGYEAGAGLGLAIVKRIVNLHGGDIQVQSTLGVGTSFQFDLPVALRPSKNIAPEPSDLSQKSLQYTPA